MHPAEKGNLKMLEVVQAAGIPSELL